MSRLNLENRRVLVRSILLRPPDTADTWEYTVSKAWLNQWTAESSSGSSQESLSEPDLVQTKITMSNNAKLNKFIPETIWRILVSWFGVHPKHLLMRRPTYFSYVNLEPIKDPYGGCHVIADRELDHLPVWVGDINEIIVDKFKTVFEVFAFDKFENIRKQVLHSLQLKSERNIRIWFGVKVVNSKMTFDPIFDMREMLITKLIEKVPKVKSLMEERSSQMNPNYGKHVGNQSSTVRLPLVDALIDLFPEQIPQICIGVEEIGVGEISNDMDSVESGIESIVSLTDVKNEWDEKLSTIMEGFSEQSKEYNQKLQDDLVWSSKQIVGDKLKEIEEIRSDYEKRFEELERRELAVRQKENENNEKEVELQNKLILFKKGLDDFQKQKRKLMDDMSRIEAQNKISDTLVTLNIGGILYTTSLETLTRDEGSLFSVMFSGRHALKKQPDGTYFIDRDGMNFRYLLNYLRDGDESIHTIPNEERVVREILHEAKHYQLTRLEKLLQGKLEDQFTSIDTRSIASI